MAATTFADDLAFLEKHTDVIVLSDKSGDSRLAVVPKMQGRIMTSSANGPLGLSFGWINRDLIASGKIAEHINVFGGEDRFWLGPEGGQFSIFFKKGVAFDLELRAGDRHRRHRSRRSGRLRQMDYRTILSGR